MCVYLYIYIQPHTHTHAETWCALAYFFHVCFSGLLPCLFLGAAPAGTGQPRLPEEAQVAAPSRPAKEHVQR